MMENRKLDLLITIDSFFAGFITVGVIGNQVGVRELSQLEADLLVLQMITFGCYMSAIFSAFQFNEFCRADPRPNPYEYYDWIKLWAQFISAAATLLFLVVIAMTVYIQIQEEIKYKGQSVLLCSSLSFYCLMCGA